MEETYTTIQGDTWDKIAKKVYGEELYADYLMQNNTEHLTIFIFPEGITLTVRELPESYEEVPLPEWRMEHE